MPECPICRQSYDSRFQVFVPPHYEAFDTVVCARRAAEVWGWDKAAPIPVILPTIGAAGARSEPRVTSAVPRRRIAALAALVVAPSQAALATGVGLLAAGTAASIYLSTQPSGTTAHSAAVAVGAPHTPQTIGPPASTQPSATGSTHARPARKAISRAKVVANRGTGRFIRSAPGRDGAAQLASQSAPLTSISHVAETPGGSPPRTPKPPPSTSKAPKHPAPATPKPPSPPANPPGPTEPPSGGGGGISATDPVPQLASVTTTKPKKSKPKPPTTSKPGPPQPPPPAPPAAVTPPEQPGSTRPGNGWGDENHDHTGPPGHEDDGNDHSSQGKGSGGDDGKDRGGGGDDNGRGHGGGGDGHGRGH